MKRIMAIDKRGGITNVVWRGLDDVEVTGDSADEVNFLLSDRRAYFEDGRTAGDTGEEVYHEVGTWPWVLAKLDWWIRHPRFASVTVQGENPFDDSPDAARP